MRSLLAFVRLTRPLFLYGGLAGVALGAAVAAWTGRRLDPATYLWVQALVTAPHLMTHYANDYFDRDCDAGTRRTAWSGGSGVLVDGALPPRVALIAALVCAAIGLAVDVRFAVVGAWAVAGIGVAIVLLAWCYSPPPVRLAARGLGEIDTVAVVAVLVPCAGYVAFAGRLDGTILAVLVAPAAAMFAMMLCVELPDAASDRDAGKRTLAVIWGPTVTRQIAAVAALAAVVSAVASVLGLHPGAAALALAPAAACAGGLIRRVYGDPRPAAIAFWGVALYASLVTGLAVLYALLAAR